MVSVTRQSPLTGIDNTMELPCTQHEIDQWKYGGGLIQDVLPQLTPDQREFLMTGCVQSDWDIMYAPEREVDRSDGNENAP
jgi:hypothetical protein